MRLFIKTNPDLCLHSVASDTYIFETETEDCTSHCVIREQWKWAVIFWVRPSFAQWLLSTQLCMWCIHKQAYDLFASVVFLNKDHLPAPLSNLS